MKTRLILFTSLLILFIGYTTASLNNPSEVEVQSGNEFFENYDDEVIMFTYYANDMDSGQAIVEPSTINSKLATGQVEDGIAIGVEPQQSQAIYPLRDIGADPIRTVDVRENEWYYDLSSSSTPSVEQRHAIIENWVTENCDDISGDGSTTYHTRAWTTGIWNTEQHYRATCFVWNEKRANVLDLSSSYREKMDVDVTVGSETQTLTNMRERTGSGDFSVTGDSDIQAGKSATFGDFAKATFEGALNPGYNFPIADNSYIANSDSLGFRVISQNNYQTYQNDLNGLENSGILEDIANDEATAQQVRDSSRAATNVALDTFLESELYSHSFNFEGRSDDARIIVDGDRRTNYPVIRFVVKGESIRYSIPDADPGLEITSDQPMEIEEGGQETFQVEVSNTGSGEADFVVNVHSCSDGFTPLDNAVEAEPSPGSSVTKELGISYGSSSTSDEDGSCTVTVENTQDDSEDVSEQVSFIGRQSNNCEPDNWFTRDDTIYKCSSDGQEEIEQDTCGDNETFDRLDDGSIVCVSQEEICGNSIDDDGDGQVDEGCGGGTVTYWVPNDDETACISNTYSEGVNPDPAFSSQEDCEEYLGQETRCFIDFEFTGLLGQQHNIELLCFQQSTIDKAKLVIILITSLSLGGVGYRIGRGLNGEQQIQGRNKYFSRRPNIDREARGNATSRTALIGLGIGLLVGAGVGWYLGFWSVVVAGGLLLTKYLLPGY